jgi:hypothetical protein
LRRLTIPQNPPQEWEDGVFVFLAEVRPSDSLPRDDESRGKLVALHGVLGAAVELQNAVAIDFVRVGTGDVAPTRLALNEACDVVSV